MNAEKKSIGISQYSYEAGLVRDSLTALQPGEQITYDELTKHAGIDVLKHRNIINRARKDLLRDEQKVYQAVSGVGLKRTTETDKVRYGGSELKKIGKKTRRVIQVVASADYENLPPEEKLKYNTNLTMLNMIQHSTGKTALAKLESKITGINKRLPLTETLAALSGK